MEAHGCNELRDCIVENFLNLYLSHFLILYKRECNDLSVIIILYKFTINNNYNNYKFNNIIDK